MVFQIHRSMVFVAVAAIVIFFFLVWGGYSLGQKYQGEQQNVGTNSTSESASSVSSLPFYMRHCEAEFRHYQDVLAENRECRSNADCFVFLSSFDCGTPLAISGKNNATVAKQEYLDCMEKSNSPLPAVDCAERMKPVCNEGKCMQKR